MILVQKAAAFPSSSPHNIHRRHPSAPSPVVVQPTRTPGLLTLSKPMQQQQQPQPRQRHSPRSKQTAPKSSVRSPQQQENVAALKPSPEIADKKAVTSATDKPQARGRQQAKSKDKPTTSFVGQLEADRCVVMCRSNSHSAVRGRRHNARQPSPPLPALTSQAEASPSPFKSTSSNLFGPFSDDSTSPPRPKAVRPAPPTLASRPSGKLAKRRQSNTGPQNAAPTPASTPAKAIPVPRRHNSANHVSRSAPGPNHIPYRSIIKASSEPPDVFPICDDVSEAGDHADNEDLVTPPRTPTPSGRAARLLYGFDDGPRTAPITASTKAFPFNGSPTPAKRGKRHARVPSEGVFAMSSDEEASTAGTNAAEIKALFGLLPRRRPAVSLTDSEREREAAAAAAAYFASSNFQNSPSPDELPPPSFV
ncbi:hypothetical protein V5O48_016995 [Marasmius crinis-equi]|uniref:Proteophosphoglycan 5 n=1 Tax=Marasmius crinis-equi TaxID=585013 RepID=A0ABR3EQ62_9AGAR